MHRERGALVGGGKCVVKLLVRHVQHHMVVARGDVVREQVAPLGHKPHLMADMRYHGPPRCNTRNGL